MWTSGLTGVWRFNGETFEPFITLRDSIAEFVQIKGFEDSKGRLWFVGFGGTLSCFEDGSFHVFPGNDVLSKLIARNLCEAMHVDSNDVIHVAAYGKGYFRLYPNGELEHVVSDGTHGPGVYVMSIEGEPFVFHLMDGANEQSLVPIYGLEQKKATLLGSFYQPNEPRYNGLNPRLRYLDRQNGDLIISWHSKLVEVTKDTVLVHSTEKPITAMMEDHQQGLWFSTPTIMSVYHLPGGNIGEVEWRPLLTDKRVHNMAEDRDGGIWFTTESQGIFHMAYPYFEVVEPQINNPLSIPNCDSMNLAEGFFFDYLVDYPKEGVFHEFDGACIRSYQLTGLSNKVNMLEHDKETEQLYLSSGSTLFIISPKGIRRIETESQSGQIRALHRSADTSEIWLSLDNHLVKLENGQVVYRSKGLPIEIADICFYNNALYAGSMSGLWKFEDSTWQDLSKQHDGFSGQIDHLTVFDNSLWVFNLRKGPVVFDGNEVQTISAPSACRIDMVQASAISNNTLTIMAFAGRLVTISIDPDSSHRYLFNIVPTPTRASNLSTTEIGKYQENWLAVNEGKLYMFLPDRYRKKRTPDFVINGVSVNQKGYRIKERFVLPSDSNEVKVSFTGLCYYGQGTHSFKYRMTGLAGWTQTLLPDVRFSNLAPGEYTFEVVAINQHCELSPSRTISFVIRPPFYKTGWFLGSVITLLILLAWLLYKLRQRAVSRKLGVLKELHTTQHMALASRMNPHFIFNSLSSIHQFTLENEKDKAADYMTEYARLMRLVMENSGKELVSLKNELEVIRIYLDLEQLRCRDKISYSIKVDPVLEAEEVEMPALFLLPYIENAIWHGLVPMDAPGGQLAIRFSASASGMKVEIEDNGVGRDKAKELGTSNHPGFQSLGNNITESRIALINKVYNVVIDIEIGDLKDVQGKSCGTRVTLVIPNF